MKKRAITLLAAMVCLTCATRLVGQSFHAGETTKLKAFLRQNAADEGKKNYQQLGIADTNAIDWATVTGLTWGADGRLTAIKWDDKYLAGDLDLSDFDSLRELRCQMNSLTSLLLTRDSALVHVDCYTNELTRMDITTNVNLQHFCCRYNRLLTLDVTRNTRLTFLCLSGNPFTRFDISNNPLLTEFYAAKCKLEEIDFSHNPHLKLVSVRSNKLKRIDVSNHADLQQLLCYDNQLTELNVKGCKSLMRLSAYDNKLTKLDLSDCRALQNLPLYNNSIAELDVSACPYIDFISTMNNGMHTLKLPLLPLKKLKIMCESNRFTFSTLPKPMYLHSYQPQARRSLTAPADAVDLSSEYAVQGTTSVYTWRDGTAEITPTTAREGRFTFPAALAGRTLTCEVTNAAYPNLTLMYDVTLTAPTANVLLAANDARPTVHSERGLLIVTSERPLTARVYTLTGVQVGTLRVQRGEASLALPPGLYIVSFSDGTARKVVVE